MASTETRRRYLKQAHVVEDRAEIDNSHAHGLAKGIKLYSYTERLNGIHPIGLVLMNVNWDNKTVKVGWSLRADSEVEPFNKAKAHLVASGRAAKRGEFSFADVTGNPTAAMEAINLPFSLAETFMAHVKWLEHRIAVGIPA